jgi:hypothetical protein
MPNENTEVTTDPTVEQVGEVEAALRAFNETQDSTTEDAVSEENTENTENTENATQETQKTVEAPQHTETELSNGFAALRRREDGLKKDRDQFNEEKRKFEEEKSLFQNGKQKEVDSLIAEYQGRLNEAKKNPIKALEQLGWTIEQAIKFVNDNGTIPQEIIEQNLRAEFKKELDEIRETSRKERESYETDKKTREQAQTLVQQQELARSYEKRVADEVEGVLKNEGAKYKYFSKVPRDFALQTVLKYMVDAHLAKKPVALSDAMLYVEGEARKTASWFGSVDAGQPDPTPGRDVKPSNPGPSVEPIPLSASARRAVLQKKHPDDMTEDERMEMALEQFK